MDVKDDDEFEGGECGEKIEGGDGIEASGGGESREERKEREVKEESKREGREWRGWEGKRMEEGVEDKAKVSLWRMGTSNFSISTATHASMIFFSFLCNYPRSSIFAISFFSIFLHFLSPQLVRSHLISSHF